MLQPKKQKYRKQFKGRVRGVAQRGNSLAYGEMGLQTLEAGWITARQIEAARVAMTRYIKRKGKVWINVFPDKPITQKPEQVRMGSGKGAVSEFVAVVKAGKVLFEMGGVDDEVGRTALNRAAQKLPLKSRIISKD
jgi:large subunit ribosomal protein L16